MPGPEEQWNGPSSHQPTEPAVYLPIELQILGIGGLLCTLSADSGWTVKKVKAVVSDQVGIPRTQQILLIGVDELWDEDAVLASLPAAAVEGHLELETKIIMTLIVQAEPPVSEALHTALKERNIAAALAILEHPRLSFINEIEPKSGWTLLHFAACRRMDEVGICLVKRPDFKVVNARIPKGCWGAGATALHFAAATGLVELVKTIVSSKDFKELGATLQMEGMWHMRFGGPVQVHRGDTAAAVALRFNQREVFAILDRAAGG